MECLTDKNGFLYTMVNNNHKFGFIKHNDIANMNNEVFLSKELFQYFIYHTYDNTIKTEKNGKGKCNGNNKSNSNRAFVIMFDLLENLENVSIDKLNTNVRNAFLYNKLNTFLIPKLNSSNNKYELYIVHNFENNYASAGKNNNSSRSKGNKQHNTSSTTSTKSGYNAIITSNPNNNKTQLQQQMFMFIIKQIQKLYDICSHRNSNNNVNNISPITKQTNHIFKSLPFHILPFPEHCTSFETALLALKICISAIKSINISWYLNTILHTKIDMSYLSSIKTSFISELKLKLFNYNKTCSQTANTSPIIYNRKSVLTKPAVNLIRRDIPGYQQYVKGATYRKKIVQRNSSDYSFNKTLSDISTVKEFAVNNKTKSNLVSTYQNTNTNVNGSEIEKFNCNTYQSGSKQSLFNVANSKFHTVKLTTQSNIDDYAYMLAQKQSLNSTNTKDNNETWLNSHSNNKYKLDVIEFTDEDKNDTIEEFNNSKCTYNEITERYKKGIAKIPKPKFRETIIMYKGGHRHPSYEHSLRNSHSLTEKAKCGNLKEECTIF